MSKDKREGYYATLKPGDMVLIYGRTGSIAKVTGITPTGRIKAAHSTYDHAGREIGGNPWAPASIQDLSTPNGQRNLELTQKRYTVARIREILGGYWQGNECEVSLEALQKALGILQNAVEESE